MTNDQLLAEVDELLRTTPPLAAFVGHDHATLPWIGRAVAVIRRWESRYSIACDAATHHLTTVIYVESGYQGLMKLLYQAQADLRMEVGQLSIVIDHGQVFHYFDELRKIVETARSDVFFIDPFLDADFVSRYLPYVAEAVEIRLLGGPKRMATLLPSVDLFVEQHHRPVQVRTSKTIHERYLFIDRTTCHSSGASFKDGAKHAPAMLNQIIDAFEAMWVTYDGLWQDGQVERRTGRGKGT